MNPNYAKAVKEDLEKLLKAGFTEPIDQATWLSSIVVVPKKNGKLRICVDFRRLNAATKKDPYPLPFMDEVLDIVIGYAAYTPSSTVFPVITKYTFMQTIGTRPPSLPNGAHMYG